MSVDQESVVDAIGLEEQTGVVVLTIADHLPWTNESDHLLILQAKLNRYLAFLESGEVYESYPVSVGRALRIDVVFRVPPTSAVDAFLLKARCMIEDAGFGLTWRLFTNGPSRENVVDNPSDVSA